MFVCRDAELRKELLKLHHDSALRGHSGIIATLHRLKNVYYWRGIRKDVYKHVQECEIFQKNKVENVAYPGLLQPLPIPERVWQDISMDFIEKLPNSSGKTTILVVVDRLSKYAHFMALKHPFTAERVAQVFMENVYKLHGLPQTIVSDRDTIFLSKFWQELFGLQGVTLHHSTAYHPQSDGQTEAINKCLEGYLRCMCGERPKN